MTNMIERQYVGGSKEEHKKNNVPKEVQEAKLEPLIKPEKKKNG